MTRFFRYSSVPCSSFFSFWADRLAPELRRLDRPGLFPLHPGQPEQFDGGVARAVAEQVELHPADGQRELDGVALDLGQGGLDLRQVVHPGLDDLAEARVGELLGLGVGLQVLDVQPKHLQQHRRAQAVAVQRLGHALDGAAELDHGQPHPGLVVAGLVGEVFRQGLLALGELALQQVLLGQRGRPGGNGQDERGQAGGCMAKHRFGLQRAGTCEGGLPERASLSSPQSACRPVRSPVTSSSLRPRKRGGPAEPRPRRPGRRC